jgi:hypothetical protein
MILTILLFSGVVILLFLIAIPLAIAESIIWVIIALLFIFICFFVYGAYLSIKYVIKSLEKW